jgi:hypothetical protein
MNNVMLDIETLSVSKNAAIISIGAVFFNPATGELGNEFYQTITRASCEAQGFDVDGDTLQWWSEQSLEARAVLWCEKATHIVLALDAFNRWILENTIDTKHIEIWGNGASFDCGILDNAFGRCNISRPWRYANERDVRTIVSLGRNLLNIDPKYDFPFVGTAHNALADAKHQAAYVSHIYQALAAKCGSPALEKTGSGNLHVSGHVIEIEGRYFRSIEKGRVITAWSIEGATKFRSYHDSKKLEKTLAELAARKKKAQVLEVGYWMREFAELQGGAA